MERIAVIGSAGCGKTSLATALAERLQLPHLELDSVHHQPDWTPLPEDDMRTIVDGFTSRPKWVVDGNYSHVADLVWGRADTVVFLDLDRRRILVRLLWRTLKRSVLQQELWNGNRERPTSLFRAEPEENILRWSWTHHHSLQDRFLRLSEAYPDPTTYRLRTPADVEVWVSAIGHGSAS